MIPFSLPSRATRELEYVEAVLASGRVSGDGPFTARATRILEDLLGGAAVRLTTSCTHALELASLVLGLGPDDEVLMPSFTFVSTANAVALRGARIRFADIDPTTFSMGLQEVKAAITPETRLVVMVHYGGVTADVDQLASLCESRGIHLLEDNAHGLFATFDGRPLGTFGALGALSFHGTKNLSCGEGGALIINDRTLLERVEVLREKGTNRSRFLRGDVDRYTWQAIGSSYLPADILAAVLVAQLEEASAWQKQRHAIWSAYRTVFAEEATQLGVELQHVPENNQHAAHVFAVLVPHSTQLASLLRRLHEKGVHAVSHFEPLHLAPTHSGSERLPVTEMVASRLVRLPLHTQMTPNDAARIARLVIEAIREEGGKG